MVCVDRTLNQHNTELDENHKSFECAINVHCAFVLLSLLVTTIYVLLLSLIFCTNEK